MSELRRDLSAGVIVHVSETVLEYVGIPLPWKCYDELIDVVLYAAIQCNTQDMGRVRLTWSNKENEDVDGARQNVPGLTS